MNIGFLVAGILSLIAVFAHGIGGEYTLRRVPTEAFPAIPNGGSHIAKQEVRMSWHGVTVIFILSSIALLLMTFTNLIVDPTTIAYVIVITFIGFGIDIMFVPLLATRQLSTLARIPQWILCFAIALATYLGMGV